MLPSITQTTSFSSPIVKATAEKERETLEFMAVNFSEFD